MDNIKKIAEKVGLADGGKDTEGNQLWIGTEKQWQEFTELQEKLDDMIENEVNEIIYNQ